MLICASCSILTPSWNRSDILPSMCGPCAQERLQELAADSSARPAFETTPSLFQIVLSSRFLHQGTARRVPARKIW